MHEPSVVCRIHNILIDPPVLVLLTKLYVFFAAAVVMLAAPALCINSTRAVTSLTLIACDLHSAAAQFCTAFNLGYYLFPQIIFGRTSDSEIETTLRGDERERIGHGHRQRLRMVSPRQHHSLA